MELDADVMQIQISRLRPEWQLDSLVPRAQSEVIEKTENMLREDSVAAQALRFMSNIVINLIGEYEHPDERIEEFVRVALHKTAGSYHALLRWLLKAPLVGFSLAEKVWGEVVLDGKRYWTYAAFPRIPATSVANNGIIKSGTQDQPTEVVQWRNTGHEIHIPGGKVIHWAFDDTGDGYGTPLGKALVPLWEAKKEVFEMCVIGIKRIGQKFVYERVPAFYGERGTERKSYVDYVIENWREARAGGIIIRPVEPNWGNLPEAKILDAGGFEGEFLDFIDWVHRNYYMALGIPALVMMEPEHATRAQAVVQSDAARFALLPLATEFANNCLLRDIVIPLIQANFGELDDYGQFPTMIPTDTEHVASLLNTLASTGVLSMMVDERVYDKIQAMFPDLLPPREEETA